MNLARWLLLSVAILAAPTSAAAAVRTTSTPSAHLRERPVLHIAAPQPGGLDQPVAWVTFRVRKHIDARRLVVRFADRSGRSYGGGASDCIRSTFVDDDGHRPQRPGRRYSVSIYTRDGIGQTRPKTLVARFTLTAQLLRVTPGRRSAPTC